MKNKKVEKAKVESLDPETITNLINQLKESWKEKKITLETIHVVLKEGMELLEQFNCTGEKKKEYVIKITRILVTDLVENETDEKIILELLDKKVLENTIDLIVQASKGQLNINNKETQQKIVSCTRSCIPIFIDTIVRIISVIRGSRSNQQSTSTSQQPQTKSLAQPLEIIIASDEVTNTNSDENIRL